MSLDFVCLPDKDTGCSSWGKCSGGQSLTAGCWANTTEQPSSYLHIVNSSKNWGHYIVSCTVICINTRYVNCVCSTRRQSISILRFPHARLPAPLGSIVSVCISFARCINFHLFMSSLNSLSCHFQSVVFSFCHSHLIPTPFTTLHHVHHISMNTGKDFQEMKDVGDCLRQHRFGKLLHPAEQRCNTNAVPEVHSSPCPAAPAVDCFLGRGTAKVFISYFFPPEAFNHCYSPGLQSISTWLESFPVSNWQSWKIKSPNSVDLFLWESDCFLPV